MTTALDELGAALTHAADFVAIGTLVCHTNRALGIFQTAIFLLAPEGRPLISVDDMRNVTDEFRTHYFEENWRALAPELRLLRTNHLPITDESTLAQLHDKAIRGGYDGETLDLYLVPLLEPAGVLGAMMCGAKHGFTEELRQSLRAVAHHASVRLAQLGVRQEHEPPIVSRLTTRQLEVAQLAAQGRSNPMIADALAVSENTIKKHLKDVFERLDITTRTELVAIFARTAPEESVPVGVTHRGRITITRAGWRPDP